MRRFLLLGKYLAVLHLSLSSVSFAVTSIAGHCPQSFIGIVQKVSRSEAPFQTYATTKLDVLFKVDEVVRGDVGDEMDVQVLKFGPHQFTLGDKFKVELRNNLICSISKVK